MTGNSRLYFRAIALGCGVALGLQTLWLAVPDIVHRQFEPASASSTARLDRMRVAAADRIARLGGVRGDLWGGFALTYGGLDWTSAQILGQTHTRETLDAVRAIANRSLGYSPHDARLWVLLAHLDTLTGRARRHAAEALKMSYYTGQGDLTLTPFRLRVAATSGALSDEDLRQMVASEVGFTIKQKAALGGALATAYRAADPAMRNLIEKATTEHDPALLAWIRSSATAQ